MTARLRINAVPEQAPRKQTQQEELQSCGLPSCIYRAFAVWSRERTKVAQPPPTSLLFVHAPEGKERH